MKTLKFALAGLLLATTPVLAQGEGDAAPEGTGETGETPADPNAGGGGGDAGGGGGDAAPAAPAAATGEMFVGKGKILIAGSTLNVNLSTDLVAKPISLAPNVFYGVNEKLVVGLTHDGGQTPMTPRPAITSISITIPNPLDPTMPITASGAGGGGICLTGEENGCGKVYNNLGFDAFYSLASSDKMMIAAHGALDIRSIDPFALSLRAGVLGSYGLADKIKLTFDPRIAVGLTERDGGNKESIDVPVWAWYEASDKLGVYLHTGINGPLDGFGDAFSVPLGVGANFGVNEKLSVGGDFHFNNMLGKNGGADARVLGIRAAYAL